MMEIVDLLVVWKFRDFGQNPGNNLILQQNNGVILRFEYPPHLMKNKILETFV